MRATLLLLFLQMPGTFLPVFLYPNEVFSQIPYAPTQEGQYIIKKLSNQCGNRTWRIPKEKILTLKNQPLIEVLC
jgi:hypothetical protein